MRLVDRHELMTLPKGTVYRAWENQCFTGDWMRLGDVPRTSTGEPIDFYEETIGPRHTEGSVWDHQLRYNGLKMVPPRLQPLVEDGRMPDYFSIDTTVCREGCFDDKTRYLVLDADDIQKMVLQLTTGLGDGNGTYYKEPKGLPEADPAQHPKPIHPR